MHGQFSQGGNSGDRYQNRRPEVIPSNLDPNGTFIDRFFSFLGQLDLAHHAPPCSGLNARLKTPYIR